MKASIVNSGLPEHPSKLPLGTVFLDEQGDVMIRMEYASSEGIAYVRLLHQGRPDYTSFDGDIYGSGSGILVNYGRLVLSV